MANTKYKNIPVKVNIYALVGAIADTHRRGLGAQVQVWMESELSHMKPAEKAAILRASGIFLDADGQKLPTVDDVA